MELFKYDTIPSYEKSKRDNYFMSNFLVKTRELIIYLNYVVIVGGQDWSIKYSNYIPKDRQHFILKQAVSTLIVKIVEH